MLSSLLFLPLFLSPSSISSSVVIAVVTLPSTKTYFSHFSNAKLINYERLVNLSTKNCINAVLSGSLLIHLSCITNKWFLTEGVAAWNQKRTNHNISMVRARSLNTGGHQRCWKETADKGAHPLDVLPGFACLSQRVHMTDWNCVRSQVIIPQLGLETKAALLLVQMRSAGPCQ